MTDRFGDDITAIEKAAAIVFEQANETVIAARKEYNEAERRMVAANYNFATADAAYRSARRRAAAVRLVRLWQYRATVRLQNQNRQSSADRLDDWIQTEILPTIKHIWPHLNYGKPKAIRIEYRTTSPYGSTVDLPRGHFPYGELKPKYYYYQPTDYKFRLLRPPWLQPSPSADTDRPALAFGQLVLSSVLTSPAKDFRHAISAGQSESYEWIERRELRLLMPKPPRNRRQKRIGLIEIWSRLPTVLCRMIFSYIV